MSVDVVQLTAADWDEGLAFINGVFFADGTRDFSTLLPSIYQPTDEFMANNHAVREDGRIRAVVGLFPLEWQVGDARLKIGGIGGVSTHPSVRGKGYMKLLMNHCVQRMQDDGMPLSWLGGQRQRYGYFGYDTCGQQVHVTLTGANVRHVFGEAPGLQFEPLMPDDTSRIDQARCLHDAQLVRNRRGGSDGFARFLASWQHRPHAAINDTGDMVGYLVADEDGRNVVELLAGDVETAVTMARSWVQATGGGSVRFDIPPTQYELVRRLSAIGETMSTGPSGNWQIFDWAATVMALLQVRAAGGGLADGATTIGIDGYGNLRLQVQGGQIACERVTTKADVTWDPSTAMRVFFGPLSPTSVTAVPEAASVLLAWCPLPLSWPRQDGV